VCAVTVAGDRAGPCGECDQGIGGGRFDFCQTSADRARPGAAPHRLVKRIIAASIQNDETQSPGRVDGLQDAIQRHGLIFDVEVAFFFPWAVSLRITGVFGLLAMLIFALVLVVALIYDYRKGALEWD